MEVRSNRIGDIRSHYRRKLNKIFDERETDTLVFLVLAEFTGFSKAEILMKHDEAVSESQLLNIHFAIKELLKEKPVQYVLEKTEFYGLPFIVNSKVLIPRPETEELIELAVQQIKKGKVVNVLDIGTGSGCIAITLKKLYPELKLKALDFSEFALEVAEKNAHMNKVEIDFLKFDVLSPHHWKIDFEADLIVTNPPYVLESEKIKMERNVLEFEPHRALFVSDEDPLVFYDAIARLGKSILKKGGGINAEINPLKSDELVNLYKKMGYKNISLHKDMSGKQRFLTCTSK